MISVWEFKTRPREDWRDGEAFSFYNWVGHELWRAGHAHGEEARREHIGLLRSLELRDATREARAIVAAVMLDHPDAEYLMDPEDVRLAREAVPLDPPIVLKDPPIGGKRFEEMGVLI